MSHRNNFKIVLFTSLSPIGRIKMFEEYGHAQTMLLKSSGSAKIRNGQFLAKWGEMGNIWAKGGKMGNFWAKWA